MNVINRIFIFLIQVYKNYFSPFLSPACRFDPTCSVYAREAFTKYPWFKALWLTITRLLRCNPFCKGGYDPLQ